AILATCAELRPSVDILSLDIHLALKGEDSPQDARVASECLMTVGEARLALWGYGPRRVRRQLRTWPPRGLGAAAIASATSASSSSAASPARRLRMAMMRSRTRAASSKASSRESRFISF